MPSFSAPLTRRDACALLLGSVFTSPRLPAQQAAGQEPADPFLEAARAWMRQGKAVPELQVNTRPNDTAMAEVALGEPLAVLGENRLHAVRIRMPEKTGHMVWAFEHTKAIRGFLVLRDRDGSKPAARSNLIKGLFERNPKEVFSPRLGQNLPSYADYRILRVPGRELQPGETLVVWYAVAEGTKTLRQSANVYPHQTYIPHRHLFPDLGLSHPKE